MSIQLMRPFLLGLGIGILALTLAACGASPTATPTQAPTPTQPPTPTRVSVASNMPAATPTQIEPTPTPTQNAEAAAWQDLIAKAKQEGEVDIVAGGSASRQFQPVVKAFEDKYGVKVNFSTGSSHKQAFRVLDERSKGIYSVDIGMTGANTSASQYIPNHAFDPIAPYLMLPEVKDPSNWYKGRFWYGDADQKYNFVYSGIVQNPPTTIEYNTNLVHPSDLNSMFDVLDPKWQGKVGAIPPTFPGGEEGYFEMYVHPQIGPDWVKKFIQMPGLFYSTDYRQLENNLADGTIAICVQCGSTRDDISNMQQQGLPVALLTKDFKESGVLVSSGSSSNIAIFNHQAHPAAAKLFLNWWLSKDGQTAMVTMNASVPKSSLRKDVGPGKTDPAQRIKAGVDYPFISTDPTLLAKRDEAIKQSQDWYNAILTQ